ncbi:DNA repair protein XRCC3 isoform X3 [Chrysemys picta bellii]|uniref:DNA repair protein XRCC3 isoform X3 n=1 Tax=Chrysemys picta bellii TaxID=8478 RepID=UPI0032B15A22
MICISCMFHKTSIYRQSPGSVLTTVLYQDMDWDQFDMNPKVIAAVKKANIKSIKEILNLSGADLQRLTKLSSMDVQCLLKTVSGTLRKSCVLTGAVYICTEDVFPNKRLQQLIDQQPTFRADVPPDVIQRIKFGNSVFIEHAADLDTFYNCIAKRITLLLLRGLVRLVVIDSMAALFRCEFGAKDSVMKARYLQTFGAKLHSLSSRFRTPILCINQVTDAVDETDVAQSNFGLLDKKVSPALGLTWSNQLLMRLMASRITQSEQSPGGALQHTGSVLRTLSVVFAPHLPPSFCCYAVNLEGVKGVKVKTPL